MLLRTATLLLLLSSASWADFHLFGPPKPKVVATPTPAPNAKTAKPAATPAPTTTAKPATKPTTAGKPGTVPATPATPEPATATKPAKRSAKPEELTKAYMPKVKAAIAAHWSEAVTPLMKDFTSGNVSVAFKLDAEGKVADFAVTQNTSNAAFAKFCEQYVRETSFEKPPEKSLTDGLVEIPFTFWIY